MKSSYTITEEADVLLDLTTDDEVISFLKDLIFLPQSYHLRDKGQVLAIKFPDKINREKVYKAILSYISKVKQVNL